MGTMSGNRITRSLAALGTTEIWTDMGNPWMCFVGMQEIRWYINMANRQGNFQFRPAYMLATTDPDSPDAPTAVGSVLTADGHDQFKVDVSGTTGKFWVKVGGLYSYSSTGGTADISYQPYFYSYGKMVGKKNVEITPTMLDTSTPAILPVTGWIDAVSISKVQAVIRLIDQLTASSIKTELYYRAAVDTLKPSEWEAMEGAPTVATVKGNSTRITSQLSFAGTGDEDVTENVVFQIGIGLLHNTGAVRGTVQVISAAIYA